MDYNNNNIPDMPQQKKKRTVLTTVVICAICVVCASLATWAVALKTMRGNDYKTPVDDIKIYTSDTEKDASTDTLIKEEDSDSAEKNGITDENIFSITQNTGKTKTASEIYAENIACVVGITAKGKTTNIFGQTTSTASSGTGFVIREDGYILTNYHVIENSTEFTVTFEDGSTYAAEVIGYENEISDIAVLKIDADGLEAVTIGSSDDLLVGEDITVIGNPLGELTFSLSKGVISALGRKINTDGTPITMFQIDAAVNSGNSGGPAFNSEGNVVGIVTAKYASEEIEGLGFCIPASDASEIASDIIQYGFVRGRATLGISCDDAYEVYSYYYRYYGNRVNQIKGLLSEGVYVTSVTDGGPADTAGIGKGDYITAVNGTEVGNCSELKEVLSSLSPGDTVTVTRCREGVYEDISLTLAEYSPMGNGNLSSSGTSI